MSVTISPEIVRLQNRPALGKFLNLNRIRYTVDIYVTCHKSYHNRENMYDIAVDKVDSNVSLKSQMLYFNLAIEIEFIVF